MDNQCKVCLKIIKKLDTMITNWEIEFFKKRGICHKCYIESKGLIKQDDHYIPWKYQNFCKIEEDAPITGDYEDCNIRLPKISWCDKYKKWKLEFQGPDLGGFDIENFVWYFDRKEDIILAICSEH